MGTPSLACPCPLTGLSYTDQGPGAHVSPWAHQLMARQGQERAGLLLPTALPFLAMGPAQPGLPLGPGSSLKTTKEELL